MTTWNLMQDVMYHLWLKESAVGPYKPEEVKQMLLDGEVAWETLAKTADSEWLSLAHFKVIKTEKELGAMKPKPSLQTQAASPAVLRTLIGEPRGYNRAWLWAASGAFGLGILLLFLGIVMGAIWMGVIGGGMMTTGLWFLILDRLDLIADLLRRK